ncbi:PEPxxWA-CTERM sorting domain-containing protein [Glacieibacterium sp.]|uniref:PEPxxWA-CTERM sorting domain-containing protein n=1 Tax=Glacieibacterium sp. TaxID=2860237 RepID=UPI003AFFFD6A
MFKTTMILLAGVVAVTGLGSAAQASTDTVQGPSGYFVPTDAQKNDSPYYRDGSQDWSWTHGAIASGFTIASLSVSAYDVDFSSGETDNIYALDSGTWILLGALTGSDSTWEYGNAFALGANFFDDIATGLQVKVDIDANNGGWIVSLGKSVLTTDGSDLPPVVPGVPEPASWALMIAGFGLVGAAARRRRNSAVAA